MGRHFPGQRAIRISVRTVHIGAAALVIGAATFGGDSGYALPVLLISGLYIVADHLFRNGLDWFRFFGSWATLLKLGLFTLAMVWPQLLLLACWAALAIGGLISHAPGNVRQWALWGEDGSCARKGQGESCSVEPAT